MRSSDNEGLLLADLEGMTIEEAKAHIATEFRAESVRWTDADPEIAAWLASAEIVVAYMHIGDYGCDSTAWALFRRDGTMYEVQGSHCSCNGFEGQWDPEETNLAAILMRRGGAFYGGGYDDRAAENIARAGALMEALHAKQ